MPLSERSLRISKRSSPGAIRNVAFPHGAGRTRASSIVVLVGMRCLRA